MPAIGALLLPLSFYRDILSTWYSHPICRGSALGGAPGVGFSAGCHIHAGPMDGL